MAAADGWHRLTEPLTTRHEYLSEVPGVTDIPGMLRGFTDRILFGQPDSWTTHVSGHPPGALNVPLGRLDAAIATLPRDREVVAYCRGPYCVLSVEAVEALRAKGFKARRLEDGFPEWKSAGLADVVNRDDVRVIECRSGACFADQTLACVGVLTRCR